MKKIKLLFLLILIVLTINTYNIICFAAYDPYLSNKCKLTKEIKTKNFNSNIDVNPTNDLTKEIKPYLLAHDKAYVYGRVLDQDCRPISDVNIKIWQNEQPNLSLSGMTTTNNLGEFIFAIFIPYNNIKLKILINHDEYFSFFTIVNLDHNDSFKSKNIKITSPWLFDGSEKYNQNNIYHQDIVIKTKNHKIRY